MSTEIPTTERLAALLKQSGCPTDMVDRARSGYYDDYKSPLATPIVQLVNDLRTLGKEALAQRAIDGEFDATHGESEAWFQVEGHKLLSQVIREKDSRRGHGKRRGFGDA